MADLPDFYTQTESILPLEITLEHGLDANKAASPVVGDIYAATDTKYVYTCYADGVWTRIGATQIAAHTAIADAHHAKYTDAEAKAAAVQAGAITNGVTKAPTHDAVYDVKVTADTATTPAEVDTKIATHTAIATAHQDAPGLIATHATDKDAHHSNIVTITFIIDGGGSAITTGQKGHLRIPFACTINRVTMLADQSGSIVVDIWKTNYAGFPPADGNSITSSAPPTITTAQKSQDSTLTGWTTAITADDTLAFNVDSCTTIERVTISLKVTKA